MNGTDWTCCWERLKGLWTGWAKDAGPAQSDAWARQFKKFDKEIFMSALQVHFEERGGNKNWGYEPSNTRMYGLCMELLRESGAEVTDPVWSKSPLEKHRELLNRLIALHRQGVVETKELGNIVNAGRNARKRLQVYEAMEQAEVQDGPFRLKPVERHPGVNPDIPVCPPAPRKRDTADSDGMSVGDILSEVPY